MAREQAEAVILTEFRDSGWEQAGASFIIGSRLFAGSAPVGAGPAGSVFFWILTDTTDPPR